MSMSVGELFVNLGVKGSDKTLNAISGVLKGLTQTKEVSFEAKAAIVGAMYALERLFAASGAMGTSLTNFNALTGDSVQMLQKLQYAGRQAGVSNQETAASFLAVKNAMANMLLGKGAPEGMAMLANKVGFDPKRARDTLYVWQQLQKFAQSVPQDIGNQQLKSFGISEGSISAMRRNAFNSNTMNAAPTYSDGEISALDRANIAWSNLGVKIEMAIGHFNARHGGGMVKDLSMMTDSVVKLAEALESASERFQLIERLGHGLEGVANTLKLIMEITDKLGGKESKKGDLLYTAPGKEAVPGLSNSPMAKAIKAFFTGADFQTYPAKPYTGPLPYGGADMIAPRVQRSIGGGAQTVEINQNLHFQHDGKEHQKNAESHKKSIKDAYRQLQSQGQGS